MAESHRTFGAIRGSLPTVAAMMLLMGMATRAPAAEPQLRGVWMHANFIRTLAEADQCIQRLQRGNFNAVFLLVWYWGGQAAFQSNLCPMLEGVQPGYDPLGHMVRECRRRKIEVHAWFVNGSYGHPTPLHVLDKHPGWAVDSGSPGARLWYDLGQPAVRRFQSDLMIEALTRYDLDGIHFDFIRYDGPALCYCKHCQAEFAERYGCGPITPGEPGPSPQQREAWAEYRKAGVTELVRDVYRRAKSVKPGVQVTAAVFAGLASAEKVFQDWPGWVRQGIVDYVLPMAYTTDDKTLAKQLAEWKTVDPRLERIVPGLGIFVKPKGSEAYAPRGIEAIFAQYRMCMAEGARGTNFYSLDGTAAAPALLLGDPLVEALRSGPFADPVPAYRPPARVPPGDFRVQSADSGVQRGDFRVQFLALCDTACREFASGRRFDSYYRDSYAVRALLAAFDLTGKQVYLDTCRRWSDRMLEFQAQMIPKGAYYMRYGRKPGQEKGDWYVGDSSSIALGILATAVRSPDPQERKRYLDSVKLYAKLVIDNYVGPEGGVTDGLWSQFNGPWWCSTGIFGSLAFLLYNETGEEIYRKAGLGAVDWLNRLDFHDVGGPISFEERPPTVVMYLLETYSVALPHLEPGSPRHRGAMAQLDKCLVWMAENQRGRVPTLPWDYHSHAKGAKFGGLPFHMYVDAQYTPDPAALRAAADQELGYIAGVLWQEAEPTISQLAVFAMLSYAQRVNPGAVYRTSRR